MEETDEAEEDFLLQSNPKNKKLSVEIEASIQTLTVSALKNLLQKQYGFDSLKLKGILKD